MEILVSSPFHGKSRQEDILAFLNTKILTGRKMAGPHHEIDVTLTNLFVT
jgi:hypothetical protein